MNNITMNIEQYKQQLKNTIVETLSEILKDNKQLFESFDSEDIKLVDNFIERVIQKSVDAEIDTLVKLNEDENIKEEDLDAFKNIITESVIYKILAGVHTLSIITNELIQEDNILESDNNEYEVYNYIIEACKRRKKKNTTSNK